MTEGSGPVPAEELDDQIARPSALDEALLMDEFSGIEDDEVGSFHRLQAAQTSARRCRLGHVHLDGQGRP